MLIIHGFRLRHICRRWYVTKYGVVWCVTPSFHDAEECARRYAREID